jgi:hypothetical protein
MSDASLGLLRRVMAFVQKAIARIHEPEKLEALLKDLGQKHYFYGAKPAYVDVSIHISFFLKFLGRHILRYGAKLFFFSSK